MRHVKVAFTLLGLCASLIARDPLTGTWKLNHDKSKYTTGAPPKAQTITIAEAGRDIDVTISGISAEGTPLFSHYTLPLTSGVGKIIEAPYDSVFGRSMGANQRLVTYMKSGKVVLRLRINVIADGKTMTATV